MKLISSTDFEFLMLNRPVWPLVHFGSTWFDAVRRGSFFSRLEFRFLFFWYTYLNVLSVLRGKTAISGEKTDRLKIWSSFLRVLISLNMFLREFPGNFSLKRNSFFEKLPNSGKKNFEFLRWFMIFFWSGKIVWVRRVRHKKKNSNILSTLACNPDWNFFYQSTKIEFLKKLFNQIR